MRMDYYKGKLPVNWVECKLKDIGEIIAGGTPSTNEPSFWGDEVSWITPADLSGYKSMFITKGRKSLSKKGLQNSSARLIPKGSVLFSSRAPIGYVVIASNELATNQGFKNIVPYSGVDSKYLYYYLIANKHIAEENASGTTFKEISASKFAELPFALAPTNEQYHIVLKLDELLSDLERGKEQLQTSLEQLKVYRQSLLKHAFEGKLSEEWRSKQKKLKTPDELIAEIKAYRKQQYEKQLKEYKEGKTKVKPKELIPLTAVEHKTLPELPNGWTYVKVSSLGDIETGTTPSKAKSEYYGNKYPFYKPTELDAGFNVREAKEYLSESGIKHARFLPANSILVTSIGATIGKTGIIRVSGASNQQINAIVPHEIFNPNFIYFQAVGQQFQDQIQLNAVATTLPIINKSKFEKLVFAICSFEEQNFIVDDIETKFSITDKMEESIIQNIKFSDTLRQSLLQKAFIGKLVEQDPHDEPASVLLERIKKEREEYLKAETGRKKIERSLYIKPRKMAEELKGIIEILKESKEPIAAKTLWQSSTYKDDIDKFYAALKKHIEAGEIIELPRNGKESHLKLANAR